MDIDPLTNTVVFEFRRWLSKVTAIAQAPTRSDDGVEHAWRSASAEKRIQASQVCRIFSEWEPTNRDVAFIRQTFPKAEVTFSFSRPDSEDAWDQALAEAHQTMMNAMGEQIRDDAQTRREEGQTQLLPVLRDFDPRDVFAKTMVHWPVGPNWAVFLAHVGLTEHGTLGVEYVLKHSLEESSQDSDELFEVAWQNLASGLKIEGGETDGVRILELSHPQGLVAGAIGLPDFLVQACSWIGQPSIFVAFTSPDQLFVTSPGTPIAEKLRDSVVKSDYWGSVALTPACLVMDSTGMRLIDSRKTS